MNSFRIGQRHIGDDFPAFIIAEISANHGQDLERAKHLVRLAKQCGADAVKCQTYTPDTMTIDCANEYFTITSGPWKNQTLYDLYAKAHMPWDWQRELKMVADEIGIIFFSTPFDLSAVDFLESINIPVYKIASFEIVDIPLIKYVAQKGKPIILSTGMSSLADIELAVKTIQEQGNQNIALMKCTSGYPAAVNDMNLRTMETLHTTFSCITGLSDHSMENSVSIAAVCLGAKIIEKHFTDDRKIPGPDSHFSLMPDEFRNLVHNIRVAENAMGNVRFTTTLSEQENVLFRKSIFVIKDIKPGEPFTNENIKVIRPGHGLHPKYFEQLLGIKAKADLIKGTPMKARYSDIDLC